MSLYFSSFFLFIFFDIFDKESIENNLSSSSFLSWTSLTNKFGSASVIHIQKGLFYLWYQFAHHHIDRYVNRHINISSIHLVCKLSTLFNFSWCKNVVLYHGYNTISTIDIYNIQSTLSINPKKIANKSFGNEVPRVIVAHAFFRLENILRVILPPKIDRSYEISFTWIKPEFRDKCQHDLKIKCLQEHMQRKKTCLYI